MTRKFLLFFTFPLLVLLLGAGVVIYRLATDRLRTEVDGRLLETCEVLRSEIAARFRAVHGDLSVVRNHPSFLQYERFKHMGQLESADLELRALLEYMVSVAEIKPIYADLRFLDEHGRSLAGVREGRRDYRAVDCSGERWFRQALALREGDQHVSSVILDRDGRPSLRFDQPVFFGADRAGMVSAEVRLADLAGEILARGAPGSFGVARLVTPDGTVVAHPEPSAAGTRSPLPSSVARAFEGFRGVATVSEAGVETRQAFLPIEATDLALVVSIPGASIYEPIADLRGTALAVTLVALVLAAILGMSLLRRVIRPLRELTVAAGGISHGDLDVALDVRTNDEVGELAASFTRMAESLKRSRAELEAERASLIAAGDALRSSQEDLRITLDSIGDAVIATDREGVVQRLNRVAEAMTGYSVEAARGKPLSYVFHVINSLTRRPVEDPVRTVLQTGEVSSLANHTILVARDGTERHIADSGAPILDQNRAIAGVVLVFRDVTESLLMQQRIQHGQRMESVGRLAGGVAHDFNNLLMIVYGHGEALLQQVPAIDAERGTELESHVRDILLAAERAAGLTSKLLAFSRRSPMAKAPCDMHALIERVVGMARRVFDKRILIHLQLDAEATIVLGDAGTLENSVLNLALNSRDAMPDGGDLTITTRSLDLDEDGARALDLKPGTHFELVVEDTGCGMERETRERIFEPFFTTKAKDKGTGLGLAAVYGTVVAHEGSIEVDSEPDRGTRMLIRLPVTLEHRVHQTAPAEVVHGSGLILVIDDEEPILRLTERWLTSLGYEVATAGDGAEALALFDARGAEVRLVLLDMVMPRLSGRDVLRELRLRRPSVPILLMSGFSESDDIDRALELGALGILPKPIDRARLSQRVGEVLGSLQESQDER